MVAAWWLKAVGQWINLTWCQLFAWQQCVLGGRFTWFERWSLSSTVFRSLHLSRCLQSPLIFTPFALRSYKVASWHDVDIRLTTDLAFYNFSNDCISATGHPIDFMFGPRVWFSRSRQTKSKMVAGHLTVIQNTKLYTLHFSKQDGARCDLRMSECVAWTWPTFIELNHFYSTCSKGNIFVIFCCCWAAETASLVAVVLCENLLPNHIRPHADRLSAGFYPLSRPVMHFSRIQSRPCCLLSLENVATRQDSQFACYWRGISMRPRRINGTPAQRTVLSRQAYIWTVCVQQRYTVHW